MEILFNKVILTLLLQFNQFKTFEEFLATKTHTIPLTNFIINLLLTAILAYLLSLIYIRFGHSLSNRKMFSKNFVVLAVTTMLIISIVKSSLALSLGLVGALSIVRFRAAIKEPEELSFLFLNIAIGLGLGADQRTITIVAFIIIAAILILRGWKPFKVNNQNLYITISGVKSNLFDPQKIVNILSNYCTMVKMKRLDENNEQIELAFLVEFPDFYKLDNARTELLNLVPNAKISFLDNKILD
ncbi:MAG TPA: DUF4956 domain-containing protein [Bacteroidales bacterium]|nr:DUF4956 domain-containing protein [Bacteroidales bacterium]